MFFKVLIDDLVLKFIHCDDARRIFIQEFEDSIDLILLDLGIAAELGELAMIEFSLGEKLHQGFFDLGLLIYNVLSQRFNEFHIVGSDFDSFGRSGFFDRLIVTINGGSKDLKISKYISKYRSILNIFDMNE